MTMSNDELEEWCSNISWIQNEMLKIIGYKVRQKQPISSHEYLYLEKIKDSEEEKVTGG